MISLQLCVLVQDSQFLADSVSETQVVHTEAIRRLFNILATWYCGRVLCVTSSLVPRL